MNKKFFCLLFCITAMLFTVKAAQEVTGTKINFVVMAAGNPVSQGGGLGNHSTPRTPILAPTVYLDDHTLILYTEFEDAIEVQLLDPDTMDDDEPTVVYSVAVPAGIQQVALPSTYTGEYGIRLVVGNWYFIGVINL